MNLALHILGTVMGTGAVLLSIGAALIRMVTQ